MKENIKLIRSKRRTLSLEINENAEIIIRAPLKMSGEHINRFITDKNEWISKKLNIIRNKQFPIRRYEEGEKFLYLGRFYELKITDTKEFLFENNFILPSSKTHKAEKIFTDWYRQRASIIFPERVKFFSDKTGLNYKSVKLSSAKKRWGSCSGKNDLNFTWRLIMAPIEIIDYVVVHELAHTVQKNHSGKFWELVGNILPDFRVRRKWLRENGYKLKL